MKIMATWFREGRGTAMGILIGALTVGSATPHLIRGTTDLPWRERCFAGALVFTVEHSRKGPSMKWMMCIGVLAMLAGCDASKDELESALEHEAETLRADKTDRAMLADLFTELSLRLKDELELPEK